MASEVLSHNLDVTYKDAVNWEALTKDQKRNLESEAVQTWILKDTYHFFENDTQEQRIKKALDLTWYERMILESKAVQTWILEDVHHFFNGYGLGYRWRFAMALPYEHIQNLESEAVKTWFLHDTYHFFDDLTPFQKWQKAMSLTEEDRGRLENKTVQQWILKDEDGFLAHLTPQEKMEKALRPEWKNFPGWIFRDLLGMSVVSLHRPENLASKDVQDWILYDRHHFFTHLKPHQRMEVALGLTDYERINLKNPDVQTWILHDVHGFCKNLSLQEKWQKALCLRDDERRNLISKAVQTWILHDVYGFFTHLKPHQRMEMALLLSERERLNLNNIVVQRWILLDECGACNNLTRQQKWQKALGLSHKERCNLNNEDVQSFFLENRFRILINLYSIERMEVALGFTQQEISNLENTMVQEALKKRILTFEQGIHLDDFHALSLTKPGVYKSLKNERLLVPTFLKARTEDEMNWINFDTEVWINSAFESFIPWLSRCNLQRNQYQKKRRPAEKTQILAHFRKQLDEGTHDHKEMALRCFDHLIQDVCHVKENTLGVNMQDFMLDTIRALKDRTHVEKSFSDVIDTLLQGLFDIHHGYLMKRQSQDHEEASPMWGTGFLHSWVRAAMGTDTDLDLRDEDHRKYAARAFETIMGVIKSVQINPEICHANPPDPLDLLKSRQDLTWL